MEETPVTVVPAQKSLAPIVVGSVLVTALLAGGGVYLVQKNQNDAAQADLQNQIDSLRLQVADSKAAATPTPVPSVAPTATPAATATPAPSATSVPGLTSSQLLNFTYKNLNGATVALVNGTGTFSVLGENTGRLTLVQNGASSVVEADLDGDGAQDRVVQLTESDGGTGSYPLIAAVLNVNGRPALAGVKGILADRATVASITVAGGVITVNGLVHGTGQSMADVPNVPKTETYRVVSGSLVAQ